MIARIHVNQHRIRENVRDAKDLPTISVKTYKSNEYGHTATICCQECGAIAARVLQKIDKPLSCGARVYVEVPDRDQVRIT